jgi:MYXO-CTERM domain-containing protein
VNNVLLYHAPVRLFAARDFEREDAMFKMNLKTVCLFTVLCALPASAWAQFNGIKVNPRVFNDFPTSTLTIVNTNSIPGSVSFDDRDMGTGNFANRHDAMLSADNGANAYNFSITEPFTISANVRLSVGSNAPRKEAGFRINSPITGDALFLVNSDAGEIVAFGGGAPFRIFGSNGGGNGYTPGTTILMGMNYIPGTGGAAGTLEYFINRGMGIETSGPLVYENLEGGPVNFQVGVYTQISPSTTNPADFATAEFNNLTAAIPEPATAGLALVGLLALGRLRRRH